MDCIKPIKITKNLDPKKFPMGLRVPCGKCLNCRIQKRREWVLRLWHEMDNWKNSIFLTLTYDNDHIPPNNTLEKKELQNFFKRLRRKIDREYKKKYNGYIINGIPIDFEKRRIRYFACGEYGESKERPHYHAIIFGLGLEEEDKKLVMDCWKLCDWKQKDIRKNSFGFVSPHSIEYVAGYINDKLSGPLAVKEYYLKNKEPVFRILSQSLGKQFVLDNAEQLIKNEKVTMFGKNMPFPRYYINLLGLEESEFRKDKVLQKEEKEIFELLGIKKSYFEFVQTESTIKTIVLNGLIRQRRNQKYLNNEKRLSMFKKKSL